MMTQAATMIEPISAPPRSEPAFARCAVVVGDCALLAASLLSGCAADRPLRTPDVTETVRTELAAPVPKAAVAVPTQVSDAGRSRSALPSLARTGVGPLAWVDLGARPRRGSRTFQRKMSTGPRAGPVAR